MAFARLLLLSSCLTILPTQPVLGQTWHEPFDQVEALVERQQADSAGSLLEQTIAQAETQFGRSDSTVDIGFFEDGVSYRLYFESFVQAESLYTKAVAVADGALSRDDPMLSAYLRKLGGVYTELGRYFEAKDTYLRALAAAEAAFGVDSRETVEILNDLGNVLCILAEYVQADSVARKALSICEDKLGPDHPSVARSLEIVGEVLMYQGHYAEADTLFNRSLRIREDELGPNHPDVARSLGWKGYACWKTGNVAEAESILTRSVQIAEDYFGPAHVEVAWCLRHLAEFNYKCVWRHAKAEQLYERIHEVFSRTYGRHHPQASLSVLDLARAKTAAAKFSEAGALAAQVLPEIEQAFGATHPSVVSALAVLASTKEHDGYWIEARELSEQAFAILDSRGEPPSPRMTAIMRRLGEILWSLGYHSETADLLSQALAISEALNDHIEYIYTAVLLSQLNLNNDLVDEAISISAKSLDIIEELYDGKHPLAINHRMTLALAADREGDFDRADTLLRGAVSCARELYGSEDANYAQTVSSLGYLYLKHCQSRLAHPLFLEVLEIYDKVFGREHQMNILTLFMLARSSASQGMYEQSLRYYDRLFRCERRVLQAVLGSASGSERIHIIHRYIPDPHDPLSIALILDTLQARELSLEIALKTEAILEEASMVDRQAAYCSQDSTITYELGHLAELRTEVANLVMSGDTKGDRLTSLYVALDSLEASLSRRCHKFKRDLLLRNFNIHDVATALPDDAVLVEILLNHPYDFASLNYEVDSSGEVTSRYVTLTLDSFGNTTITDLGSAREINTLISLARELIYDAQSMMHSTRASVAEARLNEVTRQLYDLIFAPLTEKLGGKTNLYISTDKGLNLLPFEILPMPDGSYLIERYRVSYLSSGRDLLRYRQPIESSDEVIVMADPDFENAADSPAVSSSLITASAPVSDTLIHQLRGSEGCLDNPFGRLGHGLAEGRYVAESFRKSSEGQVREFFGSQASEANLKGMEQGPGVLHLATHGYFCSNSEDLPPQYESPLLRSGLLLAGCNRTIVENTEPVNGEDGILTAFEVSGLNLNGTELVTLSACESGMSEGGSVGEGFYGLRRAFQHAGAQSVVMSLWRVPDRETRLLMQGFYDRWLSGSTKKDALRESALELLRTCREELGCGHPLLWGGFVLTGNPD